jgi:hypothetical protein
MNGTALEKRLLLHTIDAHRSLLRLEIKSIGARLRPIALLTAWGRRWSPLSKSIDEVVHTFGIDRRSRWARWTRYASLIALLLPLIRSIASRRRPDER